MPKMFACSARIPLGFNEEDRVIEREMAVGLTLLTLGSLARIGIHVSTLSVTPFVGQDSSGMVQVGTRWPVPQRRASSFEGELTSYSAWMP